MRTAPTPRPQPDPESDRCRRCFLPGRMRGALLTLERLTHIFPDDIRLKNDLGVAHLLLGDNKGAKRVFEEVCAGGWSRCARCLVPSDLWLTCRSWRSLPLTDSQRFTTDLF